MASARKQMNRHHRSTESPNPTGVKAATKLAATGYAPLENVECEVQEDMLILSGTVPSYYLKQVAQTVAGNMEGITRIENRLEVRSPR